MLAFSSLMAFLRSRQPCPTLFLQHWCNHSPRRKPNREIVVDMIMAVIRIITCTTKQTRLTTVPVVHFQVPPQTLILLGSTVKAERPISSSLVSSFDSKPARGGAMSLSADGY